MRRAGAGADGDRRRGRGLDEAHLLALLLLALPGAFFVWSMHSGVVPIFMPHLWPHSYYNTRYGLAVLPLLAVAAARW